MRDATTFVDDLGAEHSTTRDPPEAIKRAANRSTRRWRVLQAEKLRPGLIQPPSPSASAAPSAASNNGDLDASVPLIFDFAHIAKSLVKGAKSAAKSVPQWSAECAPYLVSAITGGQWPQARKAMVRSWNTTNECQLCEAEVGTIDHRFNCPCTRPAEGWPQPPEAAQRALGRMSQRQRDLLRNSGVLTIRMDGPARHSKGCFEWVRQPAEHLLDGSERWYIDGSAVNGKWRELSTTGFGVVVVARDGALLGFGLGEPPSWVRTAPAAEAWALYQVLSTLPAAPLITTDCMSLLNVALKGAEKATMAKAALARVWCGIAECLDGDTRSMVVSKRLRWTPAHLTQRSIGQTAGNTDRVITAADWRANRLADVLAKEAANRRALPKHAISKLRDAEEAARYHMALLGTVTHAANNCKMQSEINGKLTWVTKRDSLERPRAATAAQRTSRPARAAKKPDASADLPEPAPSLPPPGTAVHAALSRKQAAKKLHATRIAENEREATARAVSQLTARLSSAAESSSAADRLHALRSRVRAKAAAAAAE